MFNALYVKIVGNVWNKVKTQRTSSFLPCLHRCGHQLNKWCMRCNRQQFISSVCVGVCVQVPGNFHVSTHGATAQPQNPDMTHTIHKLAFGEKLQVRTHTWKKLHKPKMIARIKIKNRISSLYCDSGAKSPRSLQCFRRGKPPVV